MYSQSKFYSVGRQPLSPRTRLCNSRVQNTTVADDCDQADDHLLVERQMHDRSSDSEINSDSDKEKSLEENARYIKMIQTDL